MALTPACSAMMRMRRVALLKHADANPAPLIRQCDREPSRQLHRDRIAAHAFSGTLAGLQRRRNQI